ncbi:MAG: alpha/beta hydrolase [Acidobacteria bacterium]|nr:alpha/beta hydrolase [Acidobacteriota bacterium]
MPRAKSVRLLVLSLALVLLGDAGAYLVKTGAGSVDVAGIKIPTQDGQWVAADLFRPRSATEQNPAPLVVVCPGFERSKEALDSYSIELARRGMVVITIDPYSQGASSSTRQRRSATVEGYGVIPMVEYITSTPNLNYVDKSRIGAAGYSAGGNAVLQAASHFGGRKSKASAESRARAGEEGEAAGGASGKRITQSKLAAIWVGGYVLTLTDAVLRPVRSNAAMDYARYDEGAFRNANRNADMRTAPEALRFVNSGLEKSEAVPAVEIGKVYGEAARRTMRVVHNTPNLHPFLPYDRTSIGHVIDFFTSVFGMRPAIASSNQTWMWKELFTLLSLAGALLFLVPCAALLLQLPVFSPLAQPVPPALPELTRRGRLVFWINFSVSALLACYLFVPMVRATFTVFPAASQAQQTWWFPQRINNAVLLWALANGVIGIASFWLTYRYHGRHNGMAQQISGIRATKEELFRTLCLALSVLGAFYALLFTSYGVFHVDFRFLFVSAAASFPNDMLLVALEYIPLFFVFYLANSIRVNSASRFEGQAEWASMLIMGLGNSVGLALILAIQYACFVYTGTVFWTAEWLFANLLFGIVPMMFVLPYFNRYFFRATGKVYLGPMVTCFVFVMMMLTNNVCYIPR